MKKLVLFSAVLIAAAVICFGVSPATSASGPVKKEVTFNKDVASILYNNCAQCHRPNDIAPMSLFSYKEEAAVGSLDQGKGRRPRDASLEPRSRIRRIHKRSPAHSKDVDTVVAWVDQGAKEGNPKDLPKMPEFASGGLGDRQA